MKKEIKDMWSILPDHLKQEKIYRELIELAEKPFLNKTYLI
jgi:hypothetical protein